MSSTGSTVEEKAKARAASAGAKAPEVDRRRRRRAKISAQVHVKAVNSPEPFEELCMSVDVSRDGLLFTASRPGYWKGQQLDVVFPFSTAAAALNTAQRADIVRVAEQAGGKFQVAVQFQAARPDETGAQKPASHVGAANGAVPVMTKEQSVVLAAEPRTRPAATLPNT